MHSRDYKIFRSKEYYHVYNRGNNREKVFLDKQDYHVFLKRLRVCLGLEKDPKSRIRAFEPGTFSILCYCLMPNHFHFLILQNTEIPIGSLVNKVCTSYAKYFNLKYKRVGNLFQDTFKAKNISGDTYLTYLSAYIHNNPDNPPKYEFSSFIDYFTTRKGVISDISYILEYFKGNKVAYRKFVDGYTYKKHRLISGLTFEDD